MADRLEELTGSARLLELRRKMEDLKRNNDAEKRRLTVRAFSAWKSVLHGSIRASLRLLLSLRDTPQQEILSTGDFDLDSWENSPSTNRAGSPATVIGARGRLEPQRSGSSPEVVRTGQSVSPPMSQSAPNPSLMPPRTNSGLRLKPEARPAPSPSPLSMSGGMSSSSSSSSAGTPTTAEQGTTDPSEEEIKLKKRGNVVMEIINTEKDYVQDLLIVKEVYLRHLDKDNTVSKNHLNDMFSNVDQLYEVNNQVRGARRERRDT
jgi:hypothetical protein